MERHSIKGLARPRIVHVLKLMGIWMAVMVICVTTARWIGIWGITLLPIAGLVTIGILDTRFAKNRGLWTLLTLSCPKCGKWPLVLKGSQDRHDHRTFAVCEHCQIEWDLGRKLGTGFDTVAFVQGISEMADKQIENNNPPEVRQTMDRLTKEGHSLEEARHLISAVDVVEVFHMHCERKTFDPKRFGWNLAQLPKMPWDAQGKEIYKSDQFARSKWNQ